MFYLPLSIFTESEDFPFFIQYGYHYDDDCQMHGHVDFSELVIVLAGRAEHLVGKEKYPISKGEVFVINKDTEHGYNGASNFKIFLTVGVPSAMPLAFAGIKVALSSAWATLVAAELLAANAGVGYMISMGRQFGRPDIIVLGMVTIGVLGYVFNLIFDKLENIVVKWRTV